MQIWLVDPRISPKLGFLQIISWGVTKVKELVHGALRKNGMAELPQYSETFESNRPFLWHKDICRGRSIWSQICTHYLARARHLMLQFPLFWLFISMATNAGDGILQAFAVRAP